MMQTAQEPAQRVPEFPVSLDEILEHFGPIPDVVGVVRGRYPEPQDVRAIETGHLLRRGDVAPRLRHLLLAFLIEDETVGEHEGKGRTAARTAALQQGRLEPAPVLIGAFEIKDAVLARRRRL